MSGLPSTLTLGTDTGSSPQSIVSDGTVISQSSILRPSTPANFIASTSVPSTTSQRIGASGSVLQHGELGGVMVSRSLTLILRQALGLLVTTNILELHYTRFKVTKSFLGWVVLFLLFLPSNKIGLRTMDEVTPIMEQVGCDQTDALDK